MRRLLALFGLLGVLLLAGATSAVAATPYPAPPVSSSAGSCGQGLRAAGGAFAQAAPTWCPTSTTDPSSSTTDPTTQPTDPTTTSHEAAAVAEHNPLAWTGAGFNVALVVGSAIVVVLAGLALMFVGARLSRRGAYRV